MAIGVTKSHTRIEKDRKFEDYQSMKKWFSRKGKETREVIFDGAQTATNVAAEVVSGHGETIAYLGANDIVYIATEADDATQDGKSVWIDYIDSSGVLHEGVESLLSDAGTTNTEVPIGNMNILDTVAAVNGSVLTMTAVNTTHSGTYDGWYVVSQGDATDMEGSYLTILTSSLESPVKLTCTTAPDANWAADTCSIQRTLNNDVYRIRRMYCEQETLDTKEIMVCDKDNTNSYAVIAQGNTYGNAGSRYTALSTDYRCFIGRLLISVPHASTDGVDITDYQVSITFTPLSMTGQAAADITLTFDFPELLDWQPCMELEPAKDVIVKIKSIAIDEAYNEVYVSLTCLEVTK